MGGGGGGWLAYFRWGEGECIGMLLPYIIVVLCDAAATHSSSPFPKMEIS